MSGNFNLDMQPILKWMDGHMDRHFSMRFDDLAPVVVLILQDEQWRCERRVALVRLSYSKVSELNLEVEKMLQDWAARVDSGELRSLMANKCGSKGSF